MEIAIWRWCPISHGAVPKIDDAPWPAFPADLLSVAVVMATQAKGTILIHEKMFESRLFFVDKLIEMGAQIILCDPHRAVIVGPSRLHGERLESPDIRAGMAMLIAALCAEGTSVIRNIGQIDRGYERIDEKLKALGGRDRTPLRLRRHLKQAGLTQLSKHRLALAERSYHRSTVEGALFGTVGTVVAAGVI